jgi:hypothetical protein
MQGAVQSRDELRALAATPLLLTLMAQVHAFRGTLPDARARLYDECIDLLLLTWRQPRDGEPGLISRLGLSSFGSNRARRGPASNPPGSRAGGAAPMSASAGYGPAGTRQPKRESRPRQVRRDTA